MKTSLTALSLTLLTEWPAHLGNLVRVHGLDLQSSFPRPGRPVPLSGAGLGTHAWRGIANLCRACARPMVLA